MTQLPEPKTPSTLPCLFWSIVEPVFIYWACTTDLAGPKNILKLWCLFAFCVSFIILWASSQYKTKDGRSQWLKKWLGISDLASICLLAWFGWWWCGLAMAWAAFACAVNRERDGKKEEAA